MRRSFRPTFIYTDDLYNTNKHIIVGMDLSCGHCAEHERGIQCLQNLYHLTPFMFHNKPYVLQSYEKTNYINLFLDLIVDKFIMLVIKCKYGNENNII